MTDLFFCDSQIAAYTTPAYVSMDTPRAVSLLYRSSQARAMGLIQVDVTDVSTTKADKVSLRLQRPDGSFVAFTNGTTEIYFKGDSGHVSRLAAQFDATALATGVHNYTVAVTNYWPGLSYQTTSPVKVLIVNEKDSPMGWGWSVAGVQRIHANGDSLLAITEGDGSIALFRRTNCPSGCNYASPAGDVSTLTSRASVGGDGIKWDRRYPGGTVAAFATSGLLLLVKDRYGNQTTFGYTSSQLTSITDPVGKVITLAYGADAKLDAITDPGGRQVAVTIDGALNVTAIQEPGGGLAFHSTVYDGSHRLTQRSDKRGGVWTTSYDFAGALAADTVPSVVADEVTTRPVIQYSSLERAILVDPASGTGSSGTPARRLKADTIRVSVTNARGQTTKLKLDQSRGPTRIEEPLGRVSTVERDALWRVTRTSAPSGHVLKFTWHGTSRSWLTQAWDSTTGRKIDYAYETSFNQVKDVTGNTVRIWNYFGVNGHLDSTRSGFSSAPVRKFYGRADGRDTLAIDQESFTTRVLYAPSGFKNTDSVVAHGDRRTAFTYDSYGRTATVKNPANNVTTTGYDLLNRVTSTIGPSSDTTRYEYDSLYVKTVRDAIGQRYRFATNALGWVDTLVPPDSSARIVARYDRNGNRRYVVNRRGQTVETTYDALDRALEVYALTDTLSFAYDPSDRWTAVKNRESVDTLRFDIAGRLTDAITRRGASGTIRHQVTSSWDNARDLRTRYEVHTQPGSCCSSGVQEFVYNEFDQLQSLSRGGPQNEETIFGYNPRRLANSVKLPNYLEVFTNFPSTQRPGQIAYDNTTVDMAVGLNYSHDKLSRVAERKRTSADTISVNWYDGTGRLTNVSDYVDIQPVCSWNPSDGFVCDPAGRQFVRQLVFSYDKVGNRNDSGAMITAGNRLRVYGAHSFDYDADGNLTRKYRTADPATFDQQLYWNAFSQLDSVRTVRSGVPTTVRFGYDGFGRRVRKTTGAGTARFVYDGDNLILELDQAGTEVAKYTYYPGIDRPLSMKRSSELKLYFLTDQLGSVVGLVRDDETLAATYRYSPFGVQTDSTAGAVNPFRFAGREYDEETGLYYNRARYYDPQVGRFISEDPIGLEGGINVYAYAGNDPVNVTDPSGLVRCPIGTTWYQTAIVIVGNVTYRTHYCYDSNRSSGANPNPSDRGANAPRGPGGPGGPGPSSPSPNPLPPGECLAPQNEPLKAMGFEGAFAVGMGKIAGTGSYAAAGEGGTYLTTGTTIGLGAGAGPSVNVEGTKGSFSGRSRGVCWAIGMFGLCATVNSSGWNTSVGFGPMFGLYYVDTQTTLRPVIAGCIKKK